MGGERSTREGTHDSADELAEASDERVEERPPGRRTGVEVFLEGFRRASASAGKRSGTVTAWLRGLPAPSLSAVVSAAYASGGPGLVEEVLNLVSDDVRVRVGALLGVDLSFVTLRQDDEAAAVLDEIAADGAAVGAVVYLRPGLSPTDTWSLGAHELVHVAQTGGSGQGMPGDVVAEPDSMAETEAETLGAAVALYTPVGKPTVAAAPGTTLRGKGKVVGWLVKVGERKLIKKAAIYSEKELTQLLRKGYNVLVKDGRQVAKRVAEKVWGDQTLHHTGHIIKKTGQLGRSHYQPVKHMARPGEKGWHIFYSAAPVLFFDEDIQTLAVYEDKYPGKSVMNNLTVTHHVGEDSWLSQLDWINPFELVAVGADIGRDIDRERTKELKSLVFNVPTKSGGVVTFELNPEGELQWVYAVSHTGQKKTFTPQEYYVFLENAVAGATAGDDELPKYDATKDHRYAGTFDDEYRIYFSKAGYSVDFKNYAYFLPAEDARALQRVGDYYVMFDRSSKYLYVVVHPAHRQVLGQPGFLVPEDEISSYERAPDKVAYLDRVASSSVAREMTKTADPFKK